MKDSNKNPEANPGTRTQAFQRWPDERAFLHSISTPLSTLGLEIESLEALVQSAPDSALQREAQLGIQQMRKVLDQVFCLIRDRKAELPARVNLERP